MKSPLLLFSLLAGKIYDTVVKVKGNICKTVTYPDIDAMPCLQVSHITLYCNNSVVFPANREKGKN